MTFNFPTPHHHDLAANKDDLPFRGNWDPDRQVLARAITSWSALVMLKLSPAWMLGLLGASALAVPLAAQATTLGPAAARCDANASAVLVEVAGFKARSGTLRVQIYAANAKTYLEKKQWLERVEVPVAKSGAMRVCLPVSKPGSYVVSVRHDLNGNGKSDRSDGGGLSGNPDMALSDFIFKRKPKLAATSFAVGESTRRVPVTLNYINGLSFDPVS
jgi:uncharacterized protein (DUF2141 family)